MVGLVVLGVVVLLSLSRFHAVVVASLSGVVVDPSLCWSSVVVLCEFDMMNNESVIVHHSVAASPTATRHLGCVCDSRNGREGIR